LSRCRPDIVAADAHNELGKCIKFSAISRLLWVAMVFRLVTAKMARRNDSIDWNTIRAANTKHAHNRPLTSAAALATFIHSGPWDHLQEPG
jgi:hypothetical protein